jgi:hypothetical protein
MKLLQRVVMLKGVEWFTMYCPSYVIRECIPVLENKDILDFRNGLYVAARRLKAHGQRFDYGSSI